MKHLVGPIRSASREVHILAHFDWDTRAFEIVGGRVTKDGVTEAVTPDAFTPDEVRRCERSVLLWTFPDEPLPERLEALCSTS